MTFAERAADRAVEGRRARAADEVSALVESALAVLRRDGAAGLTVADVLAEAGLSTRAFYRHFRSKDELVLAVYEQDARRTQEKLVARLDAAAAPQEAFRVWIDETLALGFDPRRARRTRVLAAEGARLQAEHPGEFARIHGGVLEPLASVLRRIPTADPLRDARSVHAVAWALVVEKLQGSALTLAEARAHVMRFCRPVLEGGS